MQINCIHLHDQHLASCHWRENLQRKKEVCSALFFVFGEVPSYISSDNRNDYCGKFENCLFKAGCAHPLTFQRPNDNKVGKP